jgi:FtsH-binding integral membrane protein
MKYLSLISAILMAIGCFPLPIGYYTFLRIVVFIACVILIINDKDKGFNWSNIAFGITGIIFNPIIPIYLHDKEIWMIIDALGAILFAIKTYLFYKSEQS